MTSSRTRCIVAYVAGRLISGRDSKAIIDVAAGETVGFQGEVRNDYVAVIDVVEGSVISGQSSGRALFLSDAHTGVDIKVILDENRYYGWDLTNDKPFYGKVNDNEIVFRYPGDPVRYRYLI